ncbi:hypothetical protein TRM7557_00482 [Tritonibacter multivorans]|uniref:Uncharacterized protein n=1 Tax=Tritonibacter multivorans TaxID=928856 RepID=A0A0P1G1U7_9RHOB|nr:hypothetical protein [Tritonibacter multivorans]MDA7419520.1 hypothetical protein [Tritonibacter multivorans]CUH75627.1 hypothetical protein TRM7557_00482 [Tritonibacter multivorans]SFC63985.1 hypothetical protein SAMN04488049_103303 [Tritonibacter multivorans]
MSTEPTVEEKDQPHLPVGAHPASIQSLEKALEQLRQTANRSQFPVEVPADPKLRATAAKPQKSAPTVEPAAYVVLSSSKDRFATSEREASRRYMGAKNFF